ncbi:hypothetical protein [Novosphingobium album (ex Liu et al. 2023)]|uniref:DUF559 domain-containing protein n=1 Tax=Novosphingobium album (ex Liu et al. 2023) TaxID=3031130 RepID=A0ABT5WRK8_9SPHN|nr:hypothetical protein [Novosphingobium album (ex Liu et al. 2023)]MDE8651897.1 hypothetical protein [Novosphingobium album (ex Liu et al. 2023)]
MAVDRKNSRRQSADIRKRTPLEQAIAEKTDRNARYEVRMRQKGFKRTTIWVREDRLDEVKAFVHRLNEGAPQEPTP